MSTLKLNGKDLASQTSSAEPVIASTVTGSPAIAVTNATGVLPVGVTGGSGLDAVAGASWVKLEETNASNDATLTMGSSSIFSSTYDLYIITITGLKPVTGGSDLRAKYYLGGTLSSSGYRWSNIAHVYATEAYTSEASESHITVASDINTALQAAGDSCLNGEIYVYDPSNTDLLTNIKGHLFHFNNSNQPKITLCGGNNNTGSGAGEPALTGIQFAMSSGNINVGKFVVYGVKN